jgi:hypothetical protein
MPSDGAAALTMFAAKLYFRLINLKLIFIAGRKLFCCCLLRDARGISIIFALNYANISISFAFTQPHKIIKWKRAKEGNCIFKQPREHSSSKVAAELIEFRDRLKKFGQLE